MEGNSPERDVPPRSRGNLNSSYISSTELSSFLENEEASASVSVAGRKGFPAVQANRDDVRVTERDAGGGENESSGSRKRNRVPYPLRGKIGEYRTHRGRPLTLSLLVLSLLFLILRRLVVKCGYLFSKPHDPGNIETFTEGSVHRLLASVGVGNEEGGEQATSPPSSLTPSLEACTKEEQEVIFSSPSMSSEGTREAEEQLTGQETFAAPEGIEVQDRGRKRKTRHEADEDDHMGASPPSKQSRRDLSEVLRAHPHILAVLLKPLSSDDTTSPTKSERQAEEEAGPSVAPGAARQAAVVQELSDSEDEGEPERLLARPVGEEGIPLTDEGPGTSAQDEHIDVEDYDDEDDDFLSKADVSLDPASVQLFRRYAGPYLSSIILDTPEKQAQWIKSGLAFTPTQHSIRQGFIQLKRTSNKNLTALLHIFKSLLMLQFYIVRAVLVSRAHFHSMDKAVMARLRRAQVFMETALLRTGIPPAYIYPAQTFLTQLVAGLSRPLNFVALLRARGQEELPKPQRGNNAKSQEEGRKSQKGDNPIAKQLAADRSVLLHMVGEQSWVPALTRWLSRQPPDFAEAVPRESVVGKLMRLWSLLPDEETSSSTDSEDTSPTDWTGETEEDWLDTEDPNRTANAQLVPVYLGKAYKPLASLRDLLPIFRPLLTPEVVSLHPYAVHGPDGIRWREQMGAILVSLRGALWFRLKSLRDLQHKKDAAMQSLLRVLALTDFALSQARFAMETRPEIKEDADFLWACSRAERSAYYAWARIGLYRKATAWARRGLAAIVAGTLYHPHRTQTERQIASELSLVMRDLKTRLAGIDIARQLAEWMRQNPDPSAAIDIVTHSRLFRHFAQAESRGSHVSAATPSTALTSSSHIPPEPHQHPSSLDPTPPENPSAPSSPSYFASPSDPNTAPSAFAPDTASPFAPSHTAPPFLPHTTSHVAPLHTAPPFLPHTTSHVALQHTAWPFVPYSDPPLAPPHTAPPFLPHTTSPFAPRTTSPFAPSTTSHFAPRPTSHFAPRPTSHFAPSTTSHFAPRPTSHFAPRPTSHFAPHTAAHFVPHTAAPVARPDTVSSLAWYTASPSAWYTPSLLAPHTAPPFGWHIPPFAWTLPPSMASVFASPFASSTSSPFVSSTASPFVSSTASPFASGFTSSFTSHVTSPSASSALPPRPLDTNIVEDTADDDDVFLD